MKVWVGIDVSCKCNYSEIELNLYPAKNESGETVTFLADIKDLQEHYHRCYAPRPDYNEKRKEEWLKKHGVWYKKVCKIIGKEYLVPSGMRSESKARKSYTVKAKRASR